MKEFLVFLISSLIIFSYNVYADDDCGWSYFSDGWEITDEGIIEFLDLTLNNNDDTVEIVDYIKDADVTITIPSKIGSVDITGLGDNWLGDLNGISIYIPDNIKYFSNIDMYKRKNNVYYLKKVHMQTISLKTLE